METLSPLKNQISNRNFLTTTGFNFNLAKYPKVDFFSNTSAIPSINLGVAVQPSYLKDIPIPGDKLTYDDFTLDFIVDEEMENYLILYNWLNGLGYPNSVSQYKELVENDPFNPNEYNAMSGQSEGSLFVYNSSFNPIISVNFEGLFPVSLSTIQFDAKDQQSNYITASVTFKYTIYNIKKIIK